MSSLADGSDGSAGVFQGRISKASVFEDTRFGSVPCASIRTGATVQLLEQDDRRPIRYYLVLGEMAWRDDLSRIDKCTLEGLIQTR